MSPSAAVANTEMVTLIANATLAIHDQKTNQTYTVKQGTGIQRAPAWILDNETFIQAEKCGQITRIAKLSPEAELARLTKPDPAGLGFGATQLATVESLMANGLSYEVAQSAIEAMAIAAGTKTAPTPQPLKASDQPLGSVVPTETERMQRAGLSEDEIALITASRQPQSAEADSDGKVDDGKVDGKQKVQATTKAQTTKAPTAKAATKAAGDTADTGDTPEAGK